MDRSEYNAAGNEPTAEGAAVSREVVVFCAALIAALFLMVLVPGTVLWLPRMFGYAG